MGKIRQWPGEGPTIVLDSLEGLTVILPLSKMFMIGEKLLGLGL